MANVAVDFEEYAMDEDLLAILQSVSCKESMFELTTEMGSSVARNPRRRLRLGSWC